MVKILKKFNKQNWLQLHE